MNRLLSRRTARFSPASLRFALAAAVGVCLAASGAPVHAQSSASSTAVVLDFEVAPGVDPILGRKAADAIAVEMEASGDFNVVPRQTVEEAVATRSGLRAPYTPGTQRRLGEVLEARNVITGRILRVLVGNQAANPRVREARVELQVRQLDTRSGDFINGTQALETATDELSEVDDDILLNQATDKAAYSAIRALRLQIFPEGTVMNTTRSIIELNLGARNGVRVGQRYSVMRDVANKSRGANEATVTVERIKIGEIVISSIEQDQSRAVVAAGGTLGIHTNDKIRRIFAPGLTYVEPLINDTAGNAAGKGRGKEETEDERRRRNRNLERGSL
jgi:hypothetical protein